MGGGGESTSRRITTNTSPLLPNTTNNAGAVSSYQESPGTVSNGMAPTTPHNTDPAVNFEKWVLIINCSQMKFNEIALVLRSFLMRFFCLAEFSSDAFNFSSLKRGLSGWAALLGPYALLASKYAIHPPPPLLTTLPSSTWRFRPPWYPPLSSPPNNAHHNASIPKIRSYYRR